MEVGDSAREVGVGTLGAFVDEGLAVGLVAGLVRLDLDETACFGTIAGPSSPVPTDTTRFCIASVTKTFTTLLFADMVVRGELALDDPIGRYLPLDIKTPTLGTGREITLADLASHASGLPRDPVDWEEMGWDAATAAWVAFSPPDLRGLFEQQGDLGDGTVGTYSNIGIGVLGYICSLVCQRPYEDLLVDRVCVPLGLFDTDFADRPGPLMALGHDEDGMPEAPFSADLLSAAGGLRSTLRDMLTYVRCMLRPEVTPLSQAIRMTQHPRVPLVGEGVDPLRDWKVGLGWIVGDDVLWHNGGTHGFRSYVAFRPREGTAIAVLANTLDIAGFDEASLSVLEGAERA